MQARELCLPHEARPLFMVYVNLFLLSSSPFSLAKDAGQQGVARVVFVVIGWWPRSVLSPVEHVLVPPQIAPGT